MVTKPALPTELPADPLPLLESWLNEAFAEIRNAHAMTLATVDPEGRPTARMVLCRGFDARAGWIVFYTDRESAKGKPSISILARRSSSTGMPSSGRRVSKGP